LCARFTGVALAGAALMLSWACAPIIPRQNAAAERTIFIWFMVVWVLPDLSQESVRMAGEGSRIR
jgi:hypothetical protein